MSESEMDAWRDGSCTTRPPSNSVPCGVAAGHRVLTSPFFPSGAHSIHPIVSRPCRGRPVRRLFRPPTPPVWWVAMRGESAGEQLSPSSECARRDQVASATSAMQVKSEDEGRRDTHGMANAGSGSGVRHGPGHGGHV